MEWFSFLLYTPTLLRKFIHFLGRHDHLSNIKYHESRIGYIYLMLTFSNPLSTFKPAKHPTIQPQATSFQKIISKTQITIVQIFWKKTKYQDTKQHEHTY